MNRHRIVAVETVRLEAPPGLREELRWFYSELVGLEEPPLAPDGDGRLLVFKSAQITLIVRERPNPDIEPIRRSVTLLVPRLDLAAEELTDRGIAHQLLSGLGRHDRRLGVHDPAGNRVELKQEWPEIIL